jgi:hypothetical protein
MAILRKDIPSALAIQLSPDEAGQFLESPYTRLEMRKALTAAADNGREVRILHPDGWPLDVFTVLETVGGKTCSRSGKKLAVFLE